MNPQAITVIEFRPCTGFGTVGRSASLSIGREEVSIGYGATDDEAITEALANWGVPHAEDWAGAVKKNARIYREEPEFPNGEFNPDFIY